MGTRGEGRCAYITTTTTSHVRDGRAFIVNTLFSVSGKWPFGNCCPRVQGLGLVVTTTLRNRVDELLACIGLAVEICTWAEGTNWALEVTTSPRTRTER